MGDVRLIALKCGARGVHRAVDVIVEAMPTLASDSPVAGSVGSTTSPP